MRYPEAFVSRVRELSVDHHDDEIAQLLGAEGHQSSTGKPLTQSMIQWVRHKHRIPAPKLPANTFSVGQLGERYGVSKGVVYYWIDRGVVVAEQRKHNAPYAITIDDESDRRLREWVAQSAHLPKRKLFEVHYEHCVGMPSERSPPPGFGIITRRTGAGR